MGFGLGVNAKAYRLTTGSRATWGAADANGLHAGAAPSNLDELININGDVMINMPDGSVEMILRGGGGFKAHDYGIDDFEIKLPFLWDETDTDILALMKAKLTRTTLAIAVLSGSKATAGIIGVWADWIITGPSFNQPIANEQAIEFTLKPAKTSVPPEWVIVTA